MEYRKRFPGRRRAHERVANALKYGELVRADACQTCGTKTVTEAHHEDYRKPLKVQWLCSQCHVKRHIELGRRIFNRADAARKNGQKGGRPKKAQ